LGADLEARDEEPFNNDHVADPGSQHFDNLPSGDEPEPLISEQDEGGSVRVLDLDNLCSIAEMEDIKLSFKFVTQLQRTRVHHWRMSGCI